MLIVHWYRYTPYWLAVAVDEPLVEPLNVVVPAPETLVHKPVPVPGVLPPKEAVVKPHILCAEPTVAVVGVAFTVTVPEIVAAVHGDVCPLVVIVYVPLAVGVPLIVTVLAPVLTDWFNPAGKLLTEAFVALPPNVYIVVGIAVPAHTVGLCVPLVKLMLEDALTVTVPVGVRVGDSLVYVQEIVTSPSPLCSPAVATNCPELIYEPPPPPASPPPPVLYW